MDKAGIDPLITLLNDAKPLVQANAAVCLTNLATEGNHLTPDKFCSYLKLSIFLSKAILIMHNGP